ncbi:MAG: rocB [Firmicutes bacterium]|nr:rocB [Bacillota bacterium]
MFTIGEKIKTIAIELTKIQSIVGTHSEVDIAEKIYDYFRRIDYFQRYPEQLKLLPIRGDKLGRKNVIAVLSGGKRGQLPRVFCVWGMLTPLG